MGAFILGDTAKHNKLVNQIELSTFQGSAGKSHFLRPRKRAMDSAVLEKHNQEICRVRRKLLPNRTNGMDN